MDSVLLEKNFETRVKIESLGMNGEGVAHINGLPVFVPFALPGEICDIKIINTKGKFAIGKVVNIVSESDLRAKPCCPYFQKCGGCDLQHINYASTLLFKRDEIKKNLKNIGKIDVGVEEVTPSQPYYCRNKCALPVKDENGRAVIGMFRENSHQLVEIEDCVITHRYVKDLISICNDYFQKFGITGYNEEITSGLVRHIVAREIGEHLIITLVLTNFNIEHLDYLIEKLKQKFNFSLWLNLNEKPTNVIFGDKFKCVFGDEKIYVNILGLEVSVNPASFMQVNDEIRDKIYSRVQQEILPGSVVIDAYSGAGVMSAVCAKVAKQVFGIEIVKEAVSDANELVRVNNIRNLKNYLGDCKNVLPKLVKEVNGGDVIVVLDPPRKGCDKSVIESIIKTKPKKVIYVSCNSATLARDVRLFLDADDGLVVEKVFPFDMFPQTRHVETLLIMNRR